MNNTIIFVSGDDDKERNACIKKHIDAALEQKRPFYVLSTCKDIPYHPYYFLLEKGDMYAQAAFLVCLAAIFDEISKQKKRTDDVVIVIDRYALMSEIYDKYIYDIDLIFLIKITDFVFEEIGYSQHYVFNEDEE